MIRILLLATVVVLSLISCRRTEKHVVPIGSGILSPLTEAQKAERQNSSSGSIDEPDAMLPLADPGSNYDIVALLDKNLDFEQSDEQVLVARPTDNTEAPLEIFIASTNPVRNQYEIVWKQPVSTRALTGITLRAEDLTGNGRDDLIVAGFDESGRHVTDVFSVSKRGNLESFSAVFRLTVDGNIDIIVKDRFPAYYSGSAAGEPYDIVVQKKDVDSANPMDLIETTWNWDPSSFLYRLGPSRSVKAEKILEDRIMKVYAGNVESYESYLTGAWYRETGNASYDDILFFNPATREITFYDGSIQEIYTWGASHRTTAKRLYTRVNNAIIPSMFDTVTVSAESWDRIELWRNAQTWNGVYRRLGPGLQDVLDEKSNLPSLLERLPLTGVWRSPGDTEIVFDLPGITLSDAGKLRNGTAALFTIGGRTVLQIQFMKKNGAFEETVNWIAEYSEDRDETRIIRSLTLSPAILSVGSVRSTGTPWRRFEQIEVISPSESQTDMSAPN